MAGFRWFLVLVCLLAGAARADTEASSEVAPAKDLEVAQSRVIAAGTGARGLRTRAHIGFYVTSVHEVDWKARTFLADLYWWIRYPRPADDSKREEIESLEFIGATVDGDTQKVQERKVIPGPEGDQVYVSYRTVARFHFDADFHLYPFDRQHLPITVEHELLTREDFEFVDDRESYARSGLPESTWGIGESVRVSGLEVERVTRQFSSFEYRTDFGDTTIRQPSTHFSRVTLTIDVGRRIGPYLIKILIPLLIILLLAYLVFFVPAQELEVAAGLTVTSLLSCIAFQLTVAADLPDIGYVVVSDRIFHLCYLLVMLAMAETVLTFNLEKKGRTVLAEKIEAVSRWAYPAIFVVGMASLITYGLSSR